MITFQIVNKNSMIFLLAFFLSSIALVFTESIYKAYVINIPLRTNRLQSIVNQLNRFGISYEVYPAITPADLAAEKLLRMRGANTSRFDPETRLDFNNIMVPGKGPRPSEIGCLQSHVQILFKMAKLGSNEPFLILEDDALLEPNFYDRTVDTMKRIKSKWDIFHVGYCLEPSNMCDPAGERGPGYCKMRKQTLFCTQAYFVNGSKAAMTILNHLNVPRPGVLDHILGRSTDYYFVSLPKLAKQLPFPSDNGNNIGHWQTKMTASEIKELVLMAFTDYAFENDLEENYHEKLTLKQEEQFEKNAD